jgi:hypothetical protein
VVRESDTLSKTRMKSLLLESGLARCVTHNASLACGRRSLATKDQPHHLPVVVAARASRVRRCVTVRQLPERIENSEAVTTEILDVADDDRQPYRLADI